MTKIMWDLFEESYNFTFDHEDNILLLNLKMK